MNPFDLRGPAFLLFYVIYAAAVLIGVALVRRRVESGPPPRLDLADPYLIAMLRGGRDEAIRVAIVSLVDRGLLAVDEELWRTTDERAVVSLTHPLERALLERFGRGGDRPTSIRTDAAVDAACAELRERLEGLELLAGPAIKRARALRAWIAALVVVTPALIKLQLAAQRGHGNVGFLVVLAVIAAVAVAANRGGRVTARGDRVLADLRGLFADLERRAPSIQAGGATSELALLAAVFGLAAVPTALVPQVPELIDPRAGAGSGGTTFSSSGSCSSACGSSSGSSCGGGCGGGCGGCGG